MFFHLLKAKNVNLRKKTVSETKFGTIALEEAKVDEGTQVERQQWSNPIGRWSNQIGRWSNPIRRWSNLIGRWSNTDRDNRGQILYVCGQTRIAVVKSNRSRETKMLLNNGTVLFGQNDLGHKVGIYVYYYCLS